MEDLATLFEDLKEATLSNSQSSIDDTQNIPWTNKKDDISDNFLNHQTGNAAQYENISSSTPSLFPLHRPLHRPSPILSKDPYIPSIPSITSIESDFDSGISVGYSLAHKQENKQRMSYYKLSPGNVVRDQIPQENDQGKSNTCTKTQVESDIKIFPSDLNLG